MTGLDCTLEGSSFAEVSSFGHNGKFQFELLEISPVPLTLFLKGERDIKNPGPASGPIGPLGRSRPFEEAPHKPLPLGPVNPKHEILRSLM
jgi:hypothetical protein